MSLRKTHAALKRIEAITDVQKLSRRVDELERAIAAVRSDMRNTARSEQQRAFSREVLAHYRLLRMAASRRRAELTHGRCARCGQAVR